MSDALWRGVKQVCHLVVQTTCVGSTQTPEMFFTVKKFLKTNHNTIKFCNTDYMFFSLPQESLCSHIIKQDPTEGPVKHSILSFIDSYIHVLTLHQKVSFQEYYPLYSYILAVGLHLEILFVIHAFFSLLSNL